MNDTKRDWKSVAIRIAGYIITLISIIFLIKVIIQSNISNIKFTAPVIAISYILVLSLIYSVFFSILSYGWILILNFLNNGTPPVRFAVIMPIYTKANIMKYLPGNVMEFVGRNIMGKKLGLSHVDMAFASFIETVWILATAVIIGLIFAYSDLMRMVSWINENFSRNRFLFIVIAAVLLLLILLAIKLFFSSKIKTYNFRLFVSLKFLVLTLKLFLLYFIVLVGLGLTLALIYNLIFGVTLDTFDIMRIVSGFTVAWIVGFITPGAPGGMGVKEAGLLLLLAPAFGRENTLFASLVHRFISILGDVFAYLTGRIILALSKGKYADEKADASSLQQDRYPG